MAAAPAEAEALREALEQTVQSLWAASMVLDQGGVGDMSPEALIARMCAGRGGAPG
jgi:hypothetical protein